MAIEVQQRTWHLSWISMTVAAAAVVALVVALTWRPGEPEAPPLRLTSMAVTGQAMVEAGTVMQAHGQSMLTEGQRTADAGLVEQGQHWLRDGAQLIADGTLMQADPTLQANLQTPRRDLAAGGSLGELLRVAHAMQADSSGIQPTDLEAIRWAGLAMRAQGQTMVEHGAVMDDAIDVMATQPHLSDQEAASLRRAARALQDAGTALVRNGDDMLAYVDNMRHSLGQR